MVLGADARQNLLVIESKTTKRSSARKLISVLQRSYKKRLFRALRETLIVIKKIIIIKIKNYSKLKKNKPMQKDLRAKLFARAKVSSCKIAFVQLYPFVQKYLRAILCLRTIFYARVNLKATFLYKYYFYFPIRRVSCLVFLITKFKIQISVLSSITFKI